MASSNYSLSHKKARTIRWMGMGFLLIALMLVVSTATNSLVPGMSIECDLPRPCHDASDPMNLLPDASRAAVRADPVMHRHYVDWVARPGVRIALAVVNLIAFGPTTALLLSLGMAFRMMGRQGGQGLVRALPWLRWACRAAILLAVTQLLKQFLLSAVLLLGVDRPTLLDFTIDFNITLLPLLMASAAYATVWALRAGMRAEEDLARFV
ncbi:hypothetical protein [uncultured Sphingomonas sp.]|uniref:hypothetical protein n=1 Tax=uncultured Sphingomonas sp. TaxID=158754 RepID=UPI0025E7C785|nr:hypothetical protein [uncultured Sphingomonas sp.]